MADPAMPIAAAKREVPSTSLEDAMPLPALPTAMESDAFDETIADVIAQTTVKSEVRGYHY